MHRKFDALEKFIEFRVELDSKLGKHIKPFSSDRGGEYMSTHFDSFLKEYKVISQLSVLGTP